MGDPVTMAVIGGTIGDATNSRDPLKGALMGAVGGYAGGSMFPTAGAGGGFAGGGYGSIGTAGQTAIGSNTILGSETLGGAWKDITAANEWMNKNPITSKIGMDLAQSLLNQEQQRMSSTGAGVRQGGQIQPIDYMSLLNPQQQTVIRPATPSLI